MAGGQDVNERQRLGKGPFGRPGRLPASVCHLSLLITPHLPMPLRLLCLSVLCLCSVVASAETSWIWGAKNNVAKQEVWFRTSFELKEVPAKALLQAAADNHCVVWLNGKALGGSDDWAEAFNAEVGGDLKVGVNTIAVLARNDGGIAALSFRLSAGKAVLAESGTNWKTSLAKPGKGWENAGFDDASWAAATFVKKYGEQPWGKPFDRQAAVAKSGKRTPSTSVAAPEELILQPGFKAELLHLVPKAEQGTWVSLAVSPEGDLVAGDQGGMLWRVSLKDPNKPVVTKIDTKFFGCHGLLFAHGALYAGVNDYEKKIPSGLYRLTDSNELRIDYKASTDKPTVLNLTNHSYFNLAGAGNGDILKQVATLHASHYTPVTGKLIPTGELAPVAGTPMDFSKPTAIGTHIKADHPQLKFAEPKQGGFDFNWALDTQGDIKQLAADVYDPASGRRLQLYTTEPGVQFYTSNFLDGTVKGKGGKVYPHWGAFTLETQHYPDAPNQPDFPSTRLDPGQTYSHSVVLKFSAK